MGSGRGRVITMVTGRHRCRSWGVMVSNMCDQVMTSIYDQVNHSTQEEFS